MQKGDWVLVGADGNGGPEREAGGSPFWGRGRCFLLGYKTLNQRMSRN